MITVICGENSSQSRTYYLELKNSYINKNYNIFPIKPTEVEQIDKELFNTPTLFAVQTLFIVENLNRYISKKKNPKFTELIEKLGKRDDVNILVWEDSVPARYLKYPKSIIIKEFKLTESIFRLLDACIPGNLKQFIQLLNEVSSSTDDVFIFIMLSRHIRNLLILLTGESLIKLQSWQQVKLRNQAKFWKLNSLTDFYEGLYRIDLLAKTSASPYSIKKSLELFACYYI